MKKDLTELVFILDRSGSMSGLESDTIGGFNSLLKKQKEEPGEAIITTILFDDRYEILHDRIKIKGVEPITDREYYVRGTTALLDAVGKTINKIINVQRNTLEEERAGRIMFVIITDGMENASREYNYEKVRRLIEHEKTKYGWEFIFLGANIDAIETAEKFGIDEDRAANFHSDSQGTILNYQIISETVSNVRANKIINRDWKDRIEEDYRKRGKKGK
ncbi:VWA domain-containing protein [Tissierella creatinini]|nr:VWA domain-containing protein [Tissierella creatinini]TJX64176.1 VWA domain-containing protein [Soehngenia saccharolytica]